MQLVGVGATVLWCGVITAIMLKIIDMTVGLRVHPDVEKQGLDTALHGEQIL
nr:hypothetical protein [Alphaproteobacteria bacterium]